MRWVVAFLSSLVILVAGDQHLNANGPFGKSHMIGDEPSLDACNRGPGLLSSSTTVTVSKINVSATTYSNGEEIKITWTPLSTACKDDFVAVYFTDIPDYDGKYTTYL